ncbi:uncharacterized protein LOC113378582 [Ctenocephalides felis]|nr:uncharacterized protein LOC113378582 [Ctenocephalides felis]
MYVQPGQTVNVLVFIQVKPGAQEGLVDRLTFRANAQGDITTKSALLQVSTLGGSHDTTRPTLEYTYGSRCEGKLEYDRCSGAIWTLQISARDYDSGLLSLRSVPKGLVTSSYSAGTKEQVSAFYSASCCNPRVVLTSTDVAGNQNSYTVDVSDIYLDSASIALIVVGILLLIALVVLVVLGVLACLKRKRASRDLPAYRGERARI